MNDGDQPRVIVVGGSMGGLTAALVLRDLGMRVDVVERSPELLDGKGAGIVLQPDTVRWFREHGGTEAVEKVSTGSSRLRYIGADNEIVFDEPSTWRFTSWTTTYKALLADFGTDNYHLGEHVAGLDQDADGVTLRFVSGREERAELVVFADGISSTGRRRLLPEVVPQYSGYVGWRGTVPETEVSETTHALLSDALSYAIAPNTHICMYPIPGRDGGLAVGERDLNYVWYRNVPEGPELDELLTDKRGFPCPVSVHPGQVQDRYIDELKAAARELLPPAAAELVTRTAEPFIQPVLDIEVPRMAFGRVCLMGDGAFAARPHAAAGTAKAAADAWALADALQAADGDVVTALAKWEPGRLELGRSLLARVREMGRAYQVDNTADPADRSLRFGLYGPDQ
ncbi:NAD-binding protein [Pseudonocardia sp. K10HN5]|uniref:NAD-binding protein n=2 Tax=Pseudonocardia acidicola TaxID=2724939 RepID=A0ABX1SGN6_9PSEU|nr:FAD-dependent monooxygenase [Pseudonocardia acidicola]NMH99648.1 NAD-binding protein [Pseudonocardia acidicola]